MNEQNQRQNEIIDRKEKHYRTKQKIQERNKEIKTKIGEDVKEFNEKIVQNIIENNRGPKVLRREIGESKMEIINTIGDTGKIVNDSE